MGIILKGTFLKDVIILKGTLIKYIYRREQDQTDGIKKYIEYVLR